MVTDQMLTTEQIEAIKARRALVTQGEWEYAHGAVYRDGKPEITEYFVRRVGDDVSIAADILDPDTCDPSEANATFIAHAPTDIDALIAKVEALETELAVYRAMYLPTANMDAGQEGD